MRRLSWILMLVVILGSNAQAQNADIPYKLDELTAAKLLAEAHDGTAEYVYYYFYQHGNRWTPPFFDYEGVTETSSFGSFAVNPWTGDVWDLLGCNKITTPLYEADKAKIRQLFSAKESRQYKRLSALHPKCLT